MGQRIEIDFGGYTIVREIGDNEDAQEVSDEIQREEATYSFVPQAAKRINIIQTGENNDEFCNR
jgi:hypothetical protein